MSGDVRNHENCFLLDGFERSALLDLPRGSVLTIRLVEAVQIVDLAIVLAGCWQIHYSTSNQVALDGLHLGSGSVIWSNGAAPVPLAEVIGDSVGRTQQARTDPQHSTIGAHCTQPLWAGQAHIPRSTCQEHFEALFGNSPAANEAFADNLNLFMPVTMGDDLHPRFDACTGAAGQEITIRARHSIQVGVSLCPLGGGSTPGGTGDAFWQQQDSVENYRPVRLTVHPDTSTESDQDRLLPIMAL